MSARENYGTYPIVLSDLLDSLTPEDQRNVRLLDFDESERLAALSINKLPQTNWGTINWSQVPRVEQHDTPREPDAAEMIRQVIGSKIGPESEVVTFWANLVVPTIRTTKAIAIKAMDEIIATSHDVWLYFPSEDLIIEHFHEGRITIARLS